MKFGGFFKVKKKKKQNKNEPLEWKKINHIDKGFSVWNERAKTLSFLVSIVNVRSLHEFRLMKK